MELCKVKLSIAEYGLVTSGQWRGHGYFMAGGGGGVREGVSHAKIGPSGSLLAAKIGPTPGHIWLPKMVQVAKSDPGIYISVQETVPCLQTFV